MNGLPENSRALEHINTGAFPENSRAVKHKYGCMLGEL
jgi:hypothetical protein